MIMKFKIYTFLTYFCLISSCFSVPSDLYKQFSSIYIGGGLRSSSASFRTVASGDGTSSFGNANFDTDLFPERNGGAQKLGVNLRFGMSYVIDNDAVMNPYIALEIDKYFGGRMSQSSPQYFTISTASPTTNTLGDASLANNIYNAPITQSITEQYGLSLKIGSTILASGAVYGIFGYDRSLVNLSISGFTSLTSGDIVTQAGTTQVISKSINAPKFGIGMDVLMTKYLRVNIEYTSTRYNNRSTYSGNFVDSAGGTQSGIPLGELNSSSGGILSYYDHSNYQTKHTISKFMVNFLINL
jgi:hypothetical protein